MKFASSIAVHNPRWHTGSFVPQLTDDIHVWSIEFRNNPDYLDILDQWLSVREKEKSMQMVISLKRNYQIQAKGWLRWLLAKYINTTPEKISYTYGRLGKPYLHPEIGNIHFNSTDSGKTLLCAFSKKSELGIDIEAIPRDVKYQLIAQKKFTTVEQNIISSMPAKHQVNAFLALWTRKEAYGKAIGRGIVYPMKNVNLCDSLASSYFKVKDDENTCWYLIQFTPGNNIACLVSSKATNNILFFKLDIDTLQLYHEG